MSLPAWIFLIGVVGLAYTWVGYPLLLHLAARRRRSSSRGASAPAPDVWPSVTLLVSAHDEAAVIGAKLDDCAALDYPRERLEVVVVSDASEDGTDEIVAAHGGARLLRCERRVGKVAALNRFVPAARGEVLLFSDANCLYRPDAVRALVGALLEPGVGCACGELRYRSARAHDTADAESVYWSFDSAIKRDESALGSLAGVNGAIYAVRRELWRPVPERTFADLVTPLRVLAAGYRVVYVPEAQAVEEASPSLRDELARRTRNTSRGLRSVLHVLPELGAARCWTAVWQVLSHRVMRWLGPGFALACVVPPWLLDGGPWPAIRTVLVALGAFALAGGLLDLCRLRVRPAYRLFYAAALHGAVAVGWLRWLAGVDRGHWSVRR